MATSRNASLDGLRGVAVLLVLVYHHGLLNSGWLGVDLFFVLSGYLITTILRRERASETYWRGFWTKRVLRITPPLVLVLLLTVALSFPLSMHRAAAYMLSFGDVIAYLRPDYQPLRALWSLAVEEHFYLLWPFAIRYFQRNTLLKLLCGLIVLEPLLRGVVSLHHHQWELTYFLTPFRLDGLALGSLLAVLLEDAVCVVSVRRWSIPVGVCGVTLWLTLRFLLGSAFTRDNPTIAYNTCCYSLVAAVSACCIAHLITKPESLAARVLGTPSLAWLGLISYGMYLYQVPIREGMLRTWPHLGRASVLVDLPLTILLSAASYYFVEKPAMSLGKSPSLLRQQRTVDRETAPAR